MNILITGRDGYIGGHVAKQPSDLSDHDITIIDNLFTGNKNALLYGKSDGQILWSL